MPAPGLSPHILLGAQASRLPVLKFGHLKKRKLNDFRIRE